MTKPSPATWLPLWERALEASIEIGIRFNIAGVTREYFRNTLYEAKKLAPDPKVFDAIIMFMPGPPYDDEIWMCKREVRIEE